MSIEAMVWAMDQQVVTNPTDRLVLIVLANSAREDGTAAFPSIALIRRRSGLARRTVITSLQRLQEAGVIKPGNERVVAAHIPRADMRPKTYDLVMSNGVHLTAERGASDDISRGAAAARGASDDTNGVHLTTERGAAAAPNPSLSQHRSQQEEPPCVPPSEKSASTKTSSRATRLPENWSPNEKNLSDAISQNFTEQEVSHEAEQFRDYHLARGSSFKDWNAAWRTWLRNSRKFAAPRRTPRGPDPRRGGQPSGLVGAAMRSRAERAL